MWSRLPAVEIPKSRLTVSFLLHLIVLILLLLHPVPRVAPVRLPGTRDGSHLSLTFAPGRAPAQQNATVKASRMNTLRRIAIQPKAAEPAKQSAALYTPTPAMKPQDATPGNDALGTGDINIALLSVFPTPKPDLSQLPRGAKGDVVLDVVIDENGKIAKLTMERGVGHGVDESVIATVRNWEFHPATRNGKPVASEQELLFHFERS